MVLVIVGKTMQYTVLINFLPALCMPTAHGGQQEFFPSIIGSSLSDL
jgi:hypothetical protein